MKAPAKVRPCIRKECTNTTTELFCQLDWSALPRELRQEMIRVRDECRARPTALLESIFERLLVRAVTLLTPGASPAQSTAPAESAPAGEPAKEGA